MPDETMPDEALPDEQLPDEPLFAFQRIHLDRLRLAAEVILDLAGEAAVGDALEAELRIFKDRVETALLHPGAAGSPAPTA